MGTLLTHPHYNDNTRFHQHEKQSTMGDETTLSHQLRFPTTLIQNGWSYGQALAQFILDQGLIREPGACTMEVGGGVGDVSADFLAVIQERGKPVARHCMFDLSPRLQEAQRARLAPFGDTVHFILGDAERLRRHVRQLDFVLCNEVIADFRTISNLDFSDRPAVLDESHRKDRSHKHLAAIRAVANAMIARYGLERPRSDEASVFALNYGAIRFLEELHAALKAGGRAFISEHSAAFARVSVLPGHIEYSVSERHIERVLDVLGFRWMKGNADDFLKIDRKQRVVEDEQVNLWLMIGKDPYVYAKRGRMMDHTKLWPYQERLAADPVSHKKVDRYLTLEEFEALKQRNGWKIGKPNLVPPIIFAGTYYVLEKE